MALAYAYLDQGHLTYLLNLTRQIEVNFAQ
jgi:hypothetical protein